MKTIVPQGYQIKVYGQNELNAPEGHEFTGDFRTPESGETFLSAPADKIYCEGGIQNDRFILKIAEASSVNNLRNHLSEHVIKLLDDYRDACCPWDTARVLSARNKLESYISRYKKELEGLTPGGSEFVDDPERCAAFVKDRRDAQHEQIFRLNRVNKILEKEQKK